MIMNKHSIVRQLLALGCLSELALSAAPATFAPSPSWSLDAPPAVPAPAARVALAMATAVVLGSVLEAPKASVPPLTVVAPV